MGPSSCRKTSSGLLLILHYGELYNYFILYYNVIIIEIKCTIKVKKKKRGEWVSDSRKPKGDGIYFYPLSSESKVLRLLL